MQIHSIIKKKSLIVASAAIIGGSSALSGLGLATASADTMTVAPTTSVEHMMVGNQNSQAAINLKVAMNNLLREHVTSSLNVTRSIVDSGDSAATQAAMTAQYANSDDLSAAVGSIYGGAAQAQFSDMFREHIVQSNAYAMAVAHGDDSARQMAAAELQTYLHDIAAFFSGAIPGLQAQDVYGLLNEHEELINKSTEAYKNHDYAASYALEREALKQISRAADILSSGIVSTQPTLFQ